MSRIILIPSGINLAVKVVSPLKVVRLVVPVGVEKLEFPIHVLMLVESEVVNCVNVPDVEQVFESPMRDVIAIDIVLTGRLETVLMRPDIVVTGLGVEGVFGATIKEIALMTEEDTELVEEILLDDIVPEGVVPDDVFSELDVN